MSDFADIGSLKRSGARTQPNDVNFKLAGVTYPVLSLRLNRSIDTMADQFIVDMPWTPGNDTTFDKAAHLYAYSPTTLTIGSTLCLTGRVYNTGNKLSSSGRTKTLECYSSTVDLVDSMMPTSVRGMYEAAWMLTYAQDIASFFYGPDNKKLTATVKTGGKGKFYPALDYSPTDTCGKIMERMAFQSALLVSNDETGNIIFQDASKLATASSVGTLQEGDGLPNEFNIQADGRARFGIYVGVGQSGDADTVVESIIDPVVPRWRRSVFILEDTQAAGLVSASSWKRNKQLVKALTMSIPVSSWYAPNGKLWAPGMMVTIKSATMEIPDGFTFLIRETEHVMDSGGYKCTIKVVPPQTYTTISLVEPWVQKWGVTAWKY